MPRIRRVAPDGLAHHVLNRGNNRATIFRKEGDYRAFLELMKEAQTQAPVRLLSYAIMPTHFHFTVWPESMELLSAYMRWLMNAHVRNYHQHYGTCGHGHIWQGRFKNFPIQHESHLLRVVRYVEANPLRAGLVRRAEDWTWSSLSTQDIVRPVLTVWPVARPANWLEYVNEAASTEELQRLRYSARRGAPYGDSDWVNRVAKQSGLEFTLRPRGRPWPRDAQPASNEINNLA